MLSRIRNAISTSFIVMLMSVLSVNFLPDNLYQDFPFEPRILNLPQDTVSSPELEWNTKLTEKPQDYIHLNNIVGPESIATHNGLLYTGLADGRLVEIDTKKKDQLRTILKFNKSPQCLDNDASNPELCGRFLQVRMVNNTLYALESYRGLYSVDIQTGQLTLIASNSNSKLSLYNSFIFDPIDSNTVFLSISSTKWGLARIVWSILELETSGQIVAVDLTTKKSTVVIDKLAMANGIDVDKARDQLIFAETTAGRVNKASLTKIRNAIKSAKHGKIIEVVPYKELVSSVPGKPDNIRVEGNIAYIALPIVKHEGFDINVLVNRLPNVRKAFGRIIYGFGKLLEKANVFIKHPLIDFAVNELKSGHIVYHFQRQKSGVLEVDLVTLKSRLLGSGNFAFISEACTDGRGTMYLGSFRSPFLVRVNKP